MKKWEALHLTPDNSKQNRMEYVQDKESSRYQICEFCAEGSSEGRSNGKININSGTNRDI